MTTNDSVIRGVLAQELQQFHAGDKKVRIFHEFPVRHGLARIDMAVVNGVLHGYEIKSDRDTLLRLPEQMDAYNSVFDKVTLVVGRRHLYNALHLVPDWWGIRVARYQADNLVSLFTLREEEMNPQKDSMAMAQLLWKNEALKILESEQAAKGVRSKPRADIYRRLLATLDQDSLGQQVRETLFFRDWRPDAPLVLNGD